MISTYITSDRMAGKPGRAFSFDVPGMLIDRSLGMGYSELGRKYNKDHTTIIYHCKKNNVYPPAEVLAVHEVVEEEPLPHQKYKYQHLLEERSNPGKTYKQYLAEALTRPVEKRYHEIYYTHFNVSPPTTPARKRDQRSGRYANNTCVDEASLPDELCDRDQSGEEWPSF